MQKNTPSLISQEKNNVILQTKKLLTKIKVYKNVNKKSKKNPSRLSERYKKSI